VSCFGTLVSLFAKSFGTKQPLVRLTHQGGWHFVLNELEKAVDLTYIYMKECCLNGPKMILSNVCHCDSVQGSRAVQTPG
jgi:hypothetical protein